MPEEPAFAAAAAITAPDSPLGWQDVAASPLYGDLSSARVRVGERAVDFALPEFTSHEGVLEPTGRTVRLADLRGRPVALIFGSYT